MKRRTLLKSGGIAMFAAGGVLPPFIMRSARAAEGSRRVRAPEGRRHDLPALRHGRAHGGHAVRRRAAGEAPSELLCSVGRGPASRWNGSTLTAGSVCTPGFAPLLPMFRDGDLAIVHAAGSPHNTRSHGEAQLWWESGTPGNHRTTDGWLNRALGAGLPGSRRPAAAGRSRRRPNGRASSTATRLRQRSPTRIP